jgi:uncharacterized damage-inducible protein DinB
MSAILKSACLEIFRESFEGVKPGHQYTWYVQGKEAILDVLDTLTAEQASRPIAGAKATIGAHANHLCYFLHLFNVNNRGEEEKGDWEGSWKIQQFDEEAWKDVAARTRAEYEEASRWYQSQTTSDTDLEKDNAEYMIANIAHAAYHLGAMRALIPLIQQP